MRKQRGHTGTSIGGVVSSDFARGISTGNRSRETDRQVCWGTRRRGGNWAHRGYCCVPVCMRLCRDVVDFFCDFPESFCVPSKSVRRMKFLFATATALICSSVAGTDALTADDTKPCMYVPYVKRHDEISVNLVSLSVEFRIHEGVHHPTTR